MILCIFTRFKLYNFTSYDLQLKSLSTSIFGLSYQLIRLILITNTTEILHNYMNETKSNFVKLTILINSGKYFNAL